MLVPSIIKTQKRKGQARRRASALLTGEKNNNLRRMHGDSRVGKRSNRQEERSIQTVGQTGRGGGIVKEREREREDGREGEWGNRNREEGGEHILLWLHLHLGRLNSTNGSELTLVSPIYILHTLIHTHIHTRTCVHVYFSIPFRFITIGSSLNTSTPSVHARMDE